MINLRKVLASKEFVNRECNCNSDKKVNGICSYGGKFLKHCIVLKISCKFFDAFYAGNNQNTLLK